MLCAQCIKFHDANATKYYTVFTYGPMFPVLAIYVHFKFSALAAFQSSSMIDLFTNSF